MVDKEKFLNYTLAQNLSNYTAERATELLIDSNPRASMLQKHLAIQHRQDAEHVARKFGATTVELNAANMEAHKVLAEPENDSIKSISVESVGPYRCKHDGHGTGCEDSPDGTCSACPHVADMSKEQNGEDAEI